MEIFKTPFFGLFKAFFNQHGLMEHLLMIVETNTNIFPCFNRRINIFYNSLNIFHFVINQLYVESC